MVITANDWQILRILKSDDMYSHLPSLVLVAGAVTIETVHLVTSSHQLLPKYKLL